MSEADLIEAIAAFNSSAQGWIGLYISILSAYLVTAYMAGSKLTRSQVIIVSSGFIVFTFLSIFGAVANSIRILEFTQELRSLNPGRDFAMRKTVIVTMQAIFAGGVVAALKFMWDVRHPKSD